MVVNIFHQLGSPLHQSAALFVSLRFQLRQQLNELTQTNFVSLPLSNDSSRKLPPRLEVLPALSVHGLQSQTQLVQLRISGELALSQTFRLIYRQTSKSSSLVILQQAHSGASSKLLNLFGAITTTLSPEARPFTSTIPVNSSAQLAFFVSTFPPRTRISF